MSQFVTVLRENIERVKQKPRKVFTSVPLWLYELLPGMWPENSVLQIAYASFQVVITDIRVIWKSKEQNSMCCHSSIYTKLFMCMYVFINTPNISGNTLKKLIRAAAIREDHRWLGDRTGVRGDLLFTISTLVTFQGCAMQMYAH